MAGKILLIGDIGGTNARFALADAKQPGFGSEMTLQCADYASADDAIKYYLEQVGANHYITGPSARSYLDEAMLHDEGISVEYMAYDYPEYDQMYPPFEPHVSILDLLFID